MPKKISISESVAAAPVRATKLKTPKTSSAVKVASAPRVRSVKHSKVTAVAGSPVPEMPTASEHEQIAKIAYGYWEARGFQHGDAEQDWLRAEQEYQLLTA